MGEQRGVLCAAEQSRGGGRSCLLSESWAGAAHPMYRVHLPTAIIAFAGIMLDLTLAEKSLSILSASEHRAGDCMHAGSLCGDGMG